MNTVALWAILGLVTVGILAFLAWVGLYKFSQWRQHRPPKDWPT